MISILIILKQQQFMKDSKFFKKALNWAQNKGFKKIKANYGEFDNPKQFTRQKTGRSIVPDITAVNLGRKSYMEIALKTDDVRKKVSKWKLLSTLAKMKGGKLFLLAPRGHKAFTERLVDRYNLKAQVVSLK